MKRKIACDFLYHTKCYNIIKPFYSGIGHIIMLHRIVKDASTISYMNKNLELSQEELEYCINYFKKKKYIIISLDEVYEILNKGKSKPKFVSFTFDDGYVDNFTYAYPIFKNHGLPFSIYLTTGFPDKKVILWWYILEDLLLTRNEIVLNINNEERKYRCHTILEKYELFNQMINYILDSNQYEYFNKLENIFKPFGLNLYEKTDKMALNWEQIVKLNQDPLVTIGAHTVYHRPFGKLSEKKMKNEISGCVARIEQMTGKKVEHFSYPFGQYVEYSFKICKEMGFKTATTTIFGSIFKEHKDYLTRLPRIYSIEGMPLIKYLDIFTSGTYSAVTYKFKKYYKN